MTTQLTQGGKNAAGVATSGGLKININQFKVGPTIIQPVDGDTTTDITDSVFSGDSTQLQYAVVDNNTIEYIVTLDETIGNFNVGRIGLYADNGDGTHTLFSITALDTTNPDWKFHTSGNQVGDRLTYSIYLAISNFFNIANFTIPLLPLQSVPEASTETALPDPLHVAFDVSQVMKHSVAKTPSLAYRMTASQGVLSPAWYHRSERRIPGKGQGIVPIAQSFFDSGAPVGTVVGLDSTNSKMIKGEPATNQYITGIRSDVEHITNYGMYVDPVNTYSPMQKLYCGTGANAGKITTIANQWPIGYALGPSNTPNAVGYLCWIDFTTGYFGTNVVGPPGPAGPPGPQGPAGGGGGIMTPGCYLKKIGTNLVLTPYNGNLIVINRQVQKIPSGGVSLAPSGLSPSTLYYIYAYMSGATMMLEASVVNHVTSTLDGVEIKGSDQTRTLVGMAMTIAGPAWVDVAPGTAGPGIGNALQSGYTIGQLYVLSWFNPRPKSSTTWFSAFHRTSSGDFVELGTEIRNYFLTWAGREIHYVAGGSPGNNSPGGFGTAMAFDGGTYEKYTTGSAIGGSGDLTSPIGVRGFKRLSEGQHFGTLLGVKVGTGSGIAPWWALCIGTNSHPAGGPNHPTGGIDATVSLTVTVDG